MHGYNHTAKDKTVLKKVLKTSQVTLHTAVQFISLLLYVRAGTALCELAQFNDAKPVKISSAFGNIDFLKECFVSGKKCIGPSGTQRDATAGRVSG